MRDPMGRTPVTIVTGFLGSGKTTLLNSLLGSRNFGKVAALVNDFGAIDVDAALVAAVADDVIQLTNGCICCTINGDLFAAAKRVLALEPTVDRIVVETTGLADPLPVGLTFLQTVLRTRTVLDGVITVVDCANFALDLFCADAAMAQIVHGDFIVLNKTDLVSTETVAALEKRIALIKRHTRMFRSIRGNVSASVLFDNFEYPLALDPTRVRFHHDAHHSEGDAINTRSEVKDGFSALAWNFPASLSAARFQSWLDHALPSTVFRAKGLVHFDAQPQGYVFQLCGGRAAFERFDGIFEGVRLVFIGQHVDAVSLERDVRACLTTACN